MVGSVNKWCALVSQLDSWFRWLICCNSSPCIATASEHEPSARQRGIEFTKLWTLAMIVWSDFRASISESNGVVGGVTGIMSSGIGSAGCEIAVLYHSLVDIDIRSTPWT